MMKKISGLAAATALTCSLATGVRGQISTPLPKWEVGLSVGPFIYQGDLAPGLAGSFKEVSIGGMVSASRFLDRSFALRTGLTLGELRGDDRKYGEEAWRQARALRFRTTTFEVSETLVYDIFGNNDNHLRFSPYVFGGIGYSFLTVRRDASRFDSTYFASTQGTKIVNGLKEDLARNPPRGVLVFPIGVGVRYVPGPAWSVNLEGNYRFSKTDYLDGFSRVGNDGRNDHYYSIMLGVLFKILPSKEMKCPEESRVRWGGL
ncbi:MAG TPA: DUF6089 family protein [Puia sp.]|uniref:DUF6089 family protein n=1 Tax=Puia sp. TaxID=2045100 RepID=UPI002CDEB4BC|nr:DUF6089 family protein [Puia sp.]HVU94549.1 DUF6089 family protein [Puia sp.]